MVRKRKRHPTDFTRPCHPSLCHNSPRAVGCEDSSSAPLTYMFTCTNTPRAFSHGVSMLHTRIWKLLTLQVFYPFACCVYHREAEAPRSPPLSFLLVGLTSQNIEGSFKSNCAFSYLKSFFPPVTGVSDQGKCKFPVGSVTNATEAQVFVIS